MIRAKAAPLAREQGLALGASEYRIKPLNLKEIIGKVKAHLPA